MAGDRSDRLARGSCPPDTKSNPTRARVSAPGATSDHVTLLALDPSLTATGWIVFRLADDAVLAAGVIRTAPPKKADRKRGLKALHDARRGRAIVVEITEAIHRWQPVLAVQEASAGSKSAGAAAALARAQQACMDAVHMSMGAEPLFVSVAASKKAATGKLSASKADVEAAVRERLPADWDALLEGVAPTKRENAFDAAAAYLAAYEEPAVAMARAMARRAG